MHTIFTVCFWVGVGYTFISFFLGETVDFLNFDADVDFGLPIKPAMIAAFLTVFGGIGLVLQSKLPLTFVLLAAVGVGVLVAYLLLKFIIGPLSRAQNTSSVEIQSLVGHPATVTEVIRQGRFGQITYVVNGNTYSSPAKSEDGGEIPRYDRVEIVYIDKNVYYVKKLEG